MFVEEFIVELEVLMRWGRFGVKRTREGIYIIKSRSSEFAAFKLTYRIERQSLTLFTALIL